MLCCGCTISSIVTFCMGLNVWSTLSSFCRLRFLVGYKRRVCATIQDVWRHIPWGCQESIPCQFSLEIPPGLSLQFDINYINEGFNVLMNFYFQFPGFKPWVANDKTTKHNNTHFFNIRMLKWMNKLTHEPKKYKTKGTICHFLFKEYFVCI